MPYEILYADGGAGLITTFTGDVGEADLEAAFAESSTPPERFAKYRYVLHDYSGVERVTLTSEWIHKIAEGFAEYTKDLPDIPTAFVVPGDYQYGLLRMYKSLSSDSPLTQQLFRSREDAEAWLAEVIGASLSFA